MVNILLIGCNGLLGRNIGIRTTGKFHVLGIDKDNESSTNMDGFEYKSTDVTSLEDTKKIINDFKPAFIVNAAGYNNVDNCEANKEICWKNNVDIVKNLTKFGNSVNSKFIQFSTDFIFDGSKGNYRETDRANPINYYGRSKLAAENTVIASGIDFSIIRTSTLFDYDKFQKKENFATFVIKNLKEEKEIKIVTDQITNPTLASNLAEFTWTLIKLEKTGIFHLAGTDSVSRFEFAIRIAEIFNYNADLIKPITTDDLNQKAVRPKNSSFCIDKVINETGFKPLSLNESIKHLKNKIEKD
ncbi:SDR family oxidoreductase [candidate division KSB1 bacterium]